jgi:hypothetical protein
MVDLMDRMIVARLHDFPASELHIAKLSCLTFLTESILAI